MLSTALQSYSDSYRFREYLWELLGTGMPYELHVDNNSRLWVLSGSGLTVLSQSGSELTADNMVTFTSNTPPARMDITGTWAYIHYTASSGSAHLAALSTIDSSYSLQYLFSLPSLYYRHLLALKSEAIFLESADSLVICDAKSGRYSFTEPFAVQGQNIIDVATAPSGEIIALTNDSISKERYTIL
jgi:hypothetical protein